MRVVVTGAAGFLGSHLCDRLVADGHEVVGVDNLCTGSRENLAALLEHPRFRFLAHDVTLGLPVEGEVGGVFHLASPASPPDYLALPLETLAVGSTGTRVALDLARRTGARFLFASTSEVYGDPLVHPQPETYWGNVNPIGPRSVYDEAKRFAEALVTATRRAHGVDTRIVRIFNTYGPRMRIHDGRVVSNFVGQALRGEPITLYGSGSQTRSFCYVSDLIEGVLRVFHGTRTDPVNLGNPTEWTIEQLAGLVIRLTGSASTVVRRPLPEDDPKVRQPDIAVARRELGWEPAVPLEEGLRRTIDDFRARLGPAPSPAGR